LFATKNHSEWMHSASNSFQSKQLQIIPNFFRPTKATTTTTKPPGLPDGLFSNQNSQFWANFRGPEIGKC
jgi:hypothetical protein